MKDYFVHPKAVCETKEIGEKTRIWAFAYVLEGAKIGRDANICSHTFIESDVVLGDRVTVKSGVQLWDGLRVEDDVFIGPNATFTNDLFPRSKQTPATFEKTRICCGASIGANATIIGGITIGQNAMVGAGAVVTRSVPPNAIVVGNPGRIKGYVESIKDRPVQAGQPAMERVEEVGVRESVVAGVSLNRLPLRRDMRGSLVANEFGQDIPFEVKRSFMVFDVPGAEIRGEHAHRECHQYLICVRGACSVLAGDGNAREEFRLDHPTLGVYIPPMVWSTQFKHTEDAILLVLASHHYDPEDYIRDYQEYLDELAVR